MTRISEQVLLLLTLFIFALQLTLCATVRGGTFGETCDLERPCDQGQNLACINNSCQCASPSNQRFDNSSKKCLSVVGGPCTKPEKYPNPLRRLMGPDECIQNARCVSVEDETGSTYAECQCLDNFIENSLGECVPGIGQPCSYQPNECNPLGMVVCKNGKCQCLDELQVYDSDMKRCVSPAGTHCKYDDLQLGCVKNALCYPFFYWIPAKCLCKPGYVQTKSRQCVLEAEYQKNRKVEGTKKGSSNLFFDASPMKPVRVEVTEVRPISVGSSWADLPITKTVYINHTLGRGF